VAAPVARLARAAGERHNDDRRPRVVITVVITDDHPLFREALRSCSKAIERTGRGRGGERPRWNSAGQGARPDIHAARLRMPDTPGLATLRELSTLTPPVRTLLLTADVGNTTS